jgi:hypothetical protein
VWRVHSRDGGLAGSDLVRRPTGAGEGRDPVQCGAGAGFGSNLMRRGPA